jgi:hypothetical protein
MAFVYLGLPLAMAGLSYGPVRGVKILITIATLSSCLVMVLAPAKPLWPDQTAKDWAEKHLPDSAITSMLKRYAAFRERRAAGVDLVQMVPPDATIVAVMGGGEPLVQLWKPRRGDRRVLFLQPGETLESGRLTGVEYIIVGGIGYELHKQTISDLEEGKTPYKKIGSHQYISQLQRGPQEWTLYQRVQ